MLKWLGIAEGCHFGFSWSGGSSLKEIWILQTLIIRSICQSSPLLLSFLLTFSFQPFDAIRKWGWKLVGTLNTGSNLDGKVQKPSNLQSHSTWVFTKTAQLVMTWIIIFALVIRALKKGLFVHYHTGSEAGEPVSKSESKSHNSTSFIFWPCHILWMPLEHTHLP